MKKYFPYLLFVLILSVFLVNCEKENFDHTIQEIAQKKSVKIREIKISDIPEVRDFLIDKTEDNFFKTTEINGAIFDDDNVLEVIDTLNTTNYSFRFKYSYTPVGTFYNLIVGKSAEGEHLDPYVLKFVCNDEQLNEYMENNMNMLYFKGKILNYRFTDFFNQSIFKSGNDPCPDPPRDENGDIIPCNESDLDGSSGSGTSTGSGLPNSDPNSNGSNGTGDPNGNGDDPNGSGGVSCTTYWMAVPCTMAGHSPSDSSCTADQYPGQQSGYYQIVETCTGSKSLQGKSTDDCPGACITPLGDIGVNPPLNVINNLTGKAKCVYNSLLKQNGNLFATTIGKFIDNPSFDLTLTNGVCVTGQDGCTDGSDIANGNVTIKIANEGRGTLDLAALILHEGIHAEIYMYVEQFNQGVDPNNRPNLLGYYLQYQVDSNNLGGTTNAQHQHMADKFVRPIAEAIRALDNNRYDLEDYMGFGWDGLRKYGWDGYYDNGVWVSLDRSVGSDYYQTQQNVLNNTDFNNNCID